MRQSDAHIVAIVYVEKKKTRGSIVFSYVLHTPIAYLLCNRFALDTLAEYITVAFSASDDVSLNGAGKYRTVHQANVDILSNIYIESTIYVLPAVVDVFRFVDLNINREDWRLEVGFSL